MEIICKKNNGYKWFSDGTFFFRGYMQHIVTGAVLRNADAADCFKCVKNVSELADLLKSYVGVFAVIIRRGETVLAAVDAARSMPLYYAEDGSVISDSAEEIRQLKGIKKNDIDVYGATELYATGCVTHDKTMYRQIKQIELGCAAAFSSGAVKCATYYSHIAAVREWTKEEALKELDRRTEEMAKRLRKAIGDRPIALSLSGGYDSRYLACALRKHGFESVFCYTYGLKDSFEAVGAKRAADALGYKWIFIEYTDEAVESSLSNKSDDFLDYVLKHDCAHLPQNYIAMRELKQRELVPENSVFLFGLCYDMPTGTYIPAREDLAGYSMSVEGVAKHIVDGRFFRISLRDDVKKFFEKQVLQYFERNDIRVTDYQSFVSAEDAILTSYSHSRDYVSMGAVADFFGYEWLLPCWDTELLNFWYSTPVEFRLGKNLYVSYIAEWLCGPYGLGQKEPAGSYARVSSVKRKLIYAAANILARLWYPIGKPIKRKSDVRNTALLEVMEYKRIVQKDAVFGGRESLRLIDYIYSMEERYGTGWYRLISPLLN